MSHKRKILLDTNFLLLPAQHKVDIFSELKRICNFNYELFMLDKSIDELANIILEGKIKDRIAAKVAKALIKSKKINIIKTKEGNVDDLILEYAIKEDFIVATLDSELKKRLKAEKIQLITLRKAKYLIFGQT